MFVCRFACPRSGDLVPGSILPRTQEHLRMRAKARTAATSCAEVILCRNILTPSELGFSIVYFFIFLFGA